MNNEEDILVLDIGGNIHVTGKAKELAEYTAFVLCLLKSVQDREETDKLKHEIELAEKLGRLSFEQLLKMERDEGE